MGGDVGVIVGGAMFREVFQKLHMPIMTMAVSIEKETACIL